MVALLGAAACSAGSTVPLTITGSESRSVVVASGNDFTIVLQTVGPGEYQSPPMVSSTAVRFLDVRQAALAVPAGPTQEFRFRAVARGEAIVTFAHTGTNQSVADTVVVR